jgi:hypothetical protein
MQMQSVESSTIKALGYEPSSRTLAIEFTSGHVYHYSGISQHQFDALMAAPSKGKHFTAMIRPHIAGQKQQRKQGR